MHIPLYTALQNADSSHEVSSKTKLDGRKCSNGSASQRGRLVTNKSYEQRSKPRVEVVGIEESLTDTPPGKLGQMRFKHKWPKKTSKSAVQRDSSGTTGTENSLRVPTPDSKEKLRRRPSYPNPQVAPRRRPSWTRTRSGGLWYQKHTQSSSYGSSKSTSLFSRKSPSPQRNSSPILPLKPPKTSRKLDSISSDHKVQVETDFGDKKQGDKKKEESDTLAPVKSISNFRHASASARRVLFSPVNAFRRSQQRDGRPEEKIRAEILLSSSSIQAQGHNTLLKHQQTSFLLNRVSTILEMTGLHRSKSDRHRLESSTKTSTSSDALNGFALIQKQGQTKGLPLNTITYDELDDARAQGSFTSSIMTLKRGGTPKNTPNDEATYKVKKSASVDTEQFLKIDISVRGNTSYLPSEARRIHTPPIPEVGADGRFRGFFFDYNAPWHAYNESGGESEISTADNSLGQAVKYVTNMLPQPTDEAAGVRRSSSARHGNRRRGKTLDWYEVQLADLDEGNSSEMHQDPIRQSSCREKVQTMKATYHEAQADASMPEHLPTSPLCPRHPRYWRIVQNRGDQTRNCWMHGYGLDKSIEVLEKEKKSLTAQLGMHID